MRNLLMSTTSPIARLLRRGEDARSDPSAAGASRFAHLIGRAPKAVKPGAKAEDDTDDEKKDKDAKAEDDTDDEKKDKDAKAEDDTDDEKKDKDAKAEDDDEEAAAAIALIEASAVKAERARGTAIFAAASAGKRPDLAAHLAFETDMTAKAAVALLDKTVAGSTVAALTPRARLAERMGEVKTPNVGSDGGAPAAGTAEALAASIVAVGKKVRGEK